MDAPVVVDVAVTLLPPPELYVTANVFAVHRANNVKSLVRPCAYGNVIADPPDAAAYQPANV
jgi:hypothetical protein